MRRLLAMRFSICLLLALSLSPAFGQSAGERREVDELLDRVRAVAPEFSADFILRIAGDSKLGLSKDERIELVEEAFRLGAQAQMPWPVGGRGYHTDTRPGWREFSSETGLNSLQLQTRAIEAMRSLDP